MGAGYAWAYARVGAGAWARGMRGHMRGVCVGICAGRRGDGGGRGYGGQWLMGRHRTESPNLNRVKFKDREVNLSSHKQLKIV